MVQKSERLVKRARTGDGDGQEGQSAWDEFLAVKAVLKASHALGSNDKPNVFGNLIASINGDNELWLATVLTSPEVQRLAAAQLAAVISAVVVEHSRPDAFVMFEPSLAVTASIELLHPKATELEQLQAQHGVDVPVILDARFAGLIESWASGSDWRQLCASTSIDQGDISRIIRRTTEVLRSMVLLSILPGPVRDRAREAVVAMDRTPVSEDAWATMLENRKVGKKRTVQAPLEDDEAPLDDEENDQEEKIDEAGEFSVDLNGNDLSAGEIERWLQGLTADGPDLFDANTDIEEFDNGDPRLRAAQTDER